ncbi:hypothetical protein DPMN_090276 [Dreissena polymorpha]|uniref:Transposase n=1 Tax=Dreissena polymorpha TaxID=45954 RepID=A0A9D4KXF4_DREPO|nr:hypothetical protein DPMN_090276 [Dreissena polymorpha]
METVKIKQNRLSPPYSPDLAPMDFRVFPEVKSQLRGIRFASKQELTVAAKRIVSSFDADWIMKLHRYIDHVWQMTPIDFQVTRSKVKFTVTKKRIHTMTATTTNSPYGEHASFRAKVSG